MNKLSERSVTAFRKRILEWYARNKRAMPWRGTRDAYRVWVSEVMLQQTRVAAVEPYYRRFVRRFPTLRALARARNEEVLRLWAGLGYYSRARNLQRAARVMVAKHGGKFPREYEAALALPGVGRYTAAAVLSIAYGEARAVVDGNVARVVARLAAVRGAVRWRKLEERAQRLMGDSGKWRVASGEKRPGEWNQAMMELGATVCTPRAPRCGECPVARWCEARRMGIAERIPSARKKRASEKLEIAAAVLVDARGRTLLVRPEKTETNGLFAGMWQFPTVASGECRVARGKMHEEETKRRKVETQMTQRGTERAEKNQEKSFASLRMTNGWVSLPTVKHTVTYREMTVRPYLMRVQALPRMKGARMVALERVAEMAVSSATKKIARIAEQSVAG
ncbi:MAG: A/G-specific adenine glycosylase [Acidobacteria bacterium]|nr:A/G-specific adenine glycosylase [Acidobacteriota bacterium]